jgi:hypothetical protein
VYLTIEAISVGNQCFDFDVVQIEDLGAHECASQRRAKNRADTRAHSGRDGDAPVQRLEIQSLAEQ